METIKDLWASMVAYVSERTTNPLTSAFVLSWAAWNYKFFVLLLSDESPAEKFAAIDALYPRPETYFGGGLLYPALTALFYVFLYPYITARVVTFYRRRQVAIANSLKSIEGARVKDVEEVSRMIRAHEKELQSINSDLASSREKIEGLQRALSGAEFELNNANELLDKARTVVVEKSIDTSDRNHITTTSKSEKAIEIPQVSSESLAGGDAPASRESGVRPIGDMSTYQIEAMQLLALTPGVARKALLQLGSASELVTNYELDELIARRYIEVERELVGLTTYKLAHDGIGFLIKHDLVPPHMPPRRGLINS